MRLHIMRPKITDTIQESKMSGMLFLTIATVLLTWLPTVSAQFPNCTKADTAFCESPVTGVTNNNIIFRCGYDTGEALPGNCNDE